MARIVLGVIGGLLGWGIVFVGSERILSAIWPDDFGVHQRAFQAAIENGGQFTADTRLLLIQLVIGALACLAGGFLAALVAGNNGRAPMVLGIVLVALGVMKVVMSWPYVPIWHHVLFTALLYPLTILGGKLKG
jgi:hypothetical protein